MSDLRIAAFASSKALGFSPHSAAAKIDNSKPLKSCTKFDKARSQGIALWESSVIIEIRYDIPLGGLWKRLSSIMSFRLVKCINRNFQNTVIRSISLGISFSLATNKERNFSQFFLSIRHPDHI